MKKIYAVFAVGLQEDIWPIAVNNAGIVVGRFSEGASYAGCSFPVSPAESGDRAFLWTEGQELVDLNTLVALPPEWTLLSANDINNDGVIVGTALDGNAIRAFRLVPTE